MLRPTCKTQHCVTTLPADAAALRWEPSSFLLRSWVILKDIMLSGFLNCANSLVMRNPCVYEMLRILSK